MPLTESLILPGHTSDETTVSVFPLVSGGVIITGEPGYSLEFTRDETEQLAEFLQRVLVS